MLINSDIKKILWGGVEITEIKYMDKTVWSDGIKYTTFDDTKYFYKDSNGYYRYKGLDNVYCIAYKSNAAANELYFMRNGKLEKLYAQFDDNASGLKIYKTPANYMGVSVLAYQIRFKNIDVKLNKVLISEKELSNEQILNYFINM